MANNNNDDKRRRNLIPLNKRSKKEQRRIQAEGGKASGEARRRRKFLREMLHTALTMRLDELPDKLSEDARKALGFNGGDSVSDAIIGRLIKQAIDGDMRAIQFVFDTMGESANVTQKEKEIQIKKFAACDGFKEVMDDLKLDDE